MTNFPNILSLVNRLDDVIGGIGNILNSADNKLEAAVCEDLDRASQLLIDAFHIIDQYTDD